MEKKLNSNKAVGDVMVPLKINTLKYYILKQYGIQYYIDHLLKIICRYGKICFIL